MPKIDFSELKLRTGSIYPRPYDAEVKGRSSFRLGEAGGLTQFGANLVFLEPGARSSLRHWHENEDEFLMVTEGQLVLLEDAGKTTLMPGDCAAFPAGTPNGHCIVNEGSARGSFLVIGTKSRQEIAHYSDVDLRVSIENGKFSFTTRNGDPVG